MRRRRLRLLCRLWRHRAGAARCWPGWRRGSAPTCRSASPGSTARMGGIGERLEPAPALPACGIVLVNPGNRASPPPRCSARGAAPGRNRRRCRRAGHDAAAMAADLARLAQRPGAGRHRAAPGDRRRAGGTGGDAGLPAGADERLRRDLLRPLSPMPPRPRAALGQLQTAGPVVLGRLAATAAERGFTSRGTRPIHAHGRMGRRQGVRQRILIPPSEVRIPPAPASQHFSATLAGSKLKLPRRMPGPCLLPRDMLSITGAVRRSSQIAAWICCHRSCPATSPCWRSLRGALQRDRLRPQAVQPDHRQRGRLRVPPYFLFAHGSVLLATMACSPYAERTLPAPIAGASAG